MVAIAIQTYTDVGFNFTVIAIQTYTDVGFNFTVQ